jgi:hypothetical protein
VGHRRHGLTLEQQHRAGNQTLLAARATTFQIAVGRPARGPSQASLRRSTVNSTDLPSGPLAVNLTSCAAHGFA